MAGENSELRNQVNRELQRREELERHKRLAESRQASQARVEAELRQRRVATIAPAIARLVTAEAGSFVSLMREHGVRPVTELLDTTAPAGRETRPARNLFGMGRSKSVQQTLHSVWLLTSQMKIETIGTSGPRGYEGVKSQSYYRGLAVDTERNLWKYQGLGPSSEDGDGAGTHFAVDWMPVPVRQYDMRHPGNPYEVTHSKGISYVGAGQWHPAEHLQADGRPAAEEIIVAIDPRRDVYASLAPYEQVPADQHPAIGQWRDHLAQLAVQLVAERS